MTLTKNKLSSIFDTSPTAIHSLARRLQRILCITTLLTVADLHGQSEGDGLISDFNDGNNDWTADSNYCECLSFVEANGRLTINGETPTLDSEQYQFNFGGTL